VRCHIDLNSHAMFILCINDMSNVPLQMKSVFADDTNFFYSGSNMSQVCDILLTKFEKLHRWFHVIKLSLNAA